MVLASTSLPFSVLLLASGRGLGRVRAPAEEGSGHTPLCPVSQTPFGSLV